MIRYKVFKKNFKSNNGNIKWKIGEWQKHDGELAICKSGLHCSKRIIDAMYYTKAEIIAKVEVKGNHLEQSDKEVWNNMRILKAWKWSSCVEPKTQ